MLAALRKSLTDFYQSNPYPSYLVLFGIVAIISFMAPFVANGVTEFVFGSTPGKALGDFWKEVSQYLVTIIVLGTVGVSAVRSAIRTQTVAATAKYQEIVKKSEEIVKKNEEVVKQIGEARGSEDFSTIESKKAIATDTLFQTNLSRSFRLTTLRCRNARFFADFDWSFSREFNLLLGKNGYGKSYILHAIAGLASDNYLAISALFPKGERLSNLSLGINYQRLDTARSAPNTPATSVETAEVVLTPEGLKTTLGPIPILAIPDLRFVDKGTIKLGLDADQDIVRGGSSLFLAEQPIQGLVQTMLYQLCLDYLEQQRLDLPSVTMLERVISDLSESEFKIHSITRAGPAHFEIKVIAEGLANYPMPLQRASQGTLSVVAMFGLIERFLRALYPAKPEADVTARPAIVIIDELDAHLHPSWQRKIIRLLRETFPNVQFIVSAHSPLVVAGRLENEVSVLRKQADGQFMIEQQRTDFMGSDLDQIVRTIFESDTIDETVNTYLARQPSRAGLEALVRKLESADNRTPAEEVEREQASKELDHIARAEEGFQARMQVDDLKQSVQALKARNSNLEEEIARLQKEIGAKSDSAANATAARPAASRAAG